MIYIHLYYVLPPAFLSTAIRTTSPAMVYRTTNWFLKYASSSRLRADNLGQIGQQRYYICFPQPLKYPSFISRPQHAGFLRRGCIDSPAICLYFGRYSTCHPVPCRSRKHPVCAMINSLVRHWLFLINQKSSWLSCSAQHSVLFSLGVPPNQRDSFWFWQSNS